MDGLSRTLGIGPTVTIAGVTLSVSSRCLFNYGEVEAEILKLRKSPINQINELTNEFKGPPETLRLVLEIMLEKTKSWHVVSSRELSEFLGSFRGTVMMVWMAIRQNDPSLYTLDKVHELVSEAVSKGENLKDITTAIDQAGSQDVVGN